MQAHLLKGMVKANLCLHLQAPRLPLHHHQWMTGLALTASPFRHRLRSTLVTWKLTLTMTMSTVVAMAVMKMMAQAAKSGKVTTKSPQVVFPWRLHPLRHHHHHKRRPPKIVSHPYLLPPPRHQLCRHATYRALV